MGQVLTWHEMGSSAGVQLSSATLGWLGEIYGCALLILYNCRRNGFPWKLTHLPILNLGGSHMPKQF